jgi:hypothetical protein
MAELIARTRGERISWRVKSKQAKSRLVVIEKIFKM